MNTLHSRARRRKLSRLLLIWLPGLFIILAVLGPYAWIFITSLRPESSPLTLPLRYWPEKPGFENYLIVLRSGSFPRYFLNSVIVALGTTAGSLFLATLAAYGFARFHFRARSHLMMGLLLVYLFPAILLMVPMFVIMQKYGLLNTHAGLILSHMTFALPFSTWMLTGYLKTVPQELEEAARVDGCTLLGALFRILIPLAIPGIVATGIFSFIVSWNEFLYAIMLTTGEFARTLPVGLQVFMGAERQFVWGIVSASGMMTSLPVALLFLFFQRQFVAGLTAGAVKQ